MKKGQNNKILAFTLAEVLITLTIIGVIAAITIPNLISNYQRHETETRLREAYNIIVNAFTMAARENGGTISDLVVDAMKISTDRFEQSDYFGQNYFKPYVRHNGKECIHQVAGKNCPFRTSWITGLNDDTRPAAGKIENYYKLELYNGMDIGFEQQNGAMNIIVDINSAKGPRKFGYDVFHFKIYTDAYGIGGVSGRDYKDKIIPNYSCPVMNKCICSGDGYDCAGVIARNSWKIPDDYPVKKF